MKYGAMQRNQRLQGGAVVALVLRTGRRWWMPVIQSRHELVDIRRCQVADELDLGHHS